MKSSGAITSKILYWNELRSLCAARGPCITITLPAYHHGIGAVPYSTNLQSAVHLAERTLVKDDPYQDTEPLLGPLRNLASEFESSAGDRAKVIFASPGIFDQYDLPAPSPLRAVVGPYFHLLPILGQLRAAQEFFILELNEEHLRVLHYYDNSCEEVSLPSGLSAQDSGEFRPPDHTLRDASPAGRALAAHSAVVFTTSTEREKGHERLHEFFRIVDRRLSKLLAGKPLLLSGASYEVDIYRSESTYQHLVEGSLDRDLHDLSLKDIARRASEFAQVQAGLLAEQQLRVLEEMSRTERRSFDLHRILEAAGQGRVAKLILAVPEAAPIDGNSISKPEDHEALLNAAAVLSIRHGAEIFVLRAEAPAGSRPVAAMFHY